MSFGGGSVETATKPQQRHTFTYLVSFSFELTSLDGSSKTSLVDELSPKAVSFQVSVEGTGTVFSSSSSTSLLSMSLVVDEQESGDMSSVFSVLTL